MDSNDIYNRIVRAFCGSGLKLDRCRRLEEFPPDIQRFLGLLLASDDSLQVITGAVLAHAFTSDQTAFMLSVGIIGEMLERCPDSKLKSANDNTIYTFFKRAKKMGLEEIYPSIKAGKGQKTRSGLYRIKFPELRAFFSEEALGREEEIVKEYEDTNGIGRADTSAQTKAKHQSGHSAVKNEEGELVKRGEKWRWHKVTHGYHRWVDANPTEEEIAEYYERHPREKKSD